MRELWPPRIIIFSFYKTVLSKSSFCLGSVTSKCKLNNLGNFMLPWQPRKDFSCLFFIQFRLPDSPDLVTQNSEFSSKITYSWIMKTQPNWKQTNWHYYFKDMVYSLICYISNATGNHFVISIHQMAMFMHETVMSN